MNWSDASTRTSTVRRGSGRRGVRLHVRWALITVLSWRQPGDPVRYSEIIPVQQARGISAGWLAEVLQEMGVLDDDRRPSFESWLERKLDGLAPGIRADAEAWLRTLRVCHVVSVLLSSVIEPWIAASSS